MTVPLLRDEALADLSPENQRARRDLRAQFDRLPDEAIERLQYFQPQIGCFNRCAFCSQSAGTDIWQLTRTGLRDFVAALAATTRGRSPRVSGLGGGRRHKPFVIFPYVDNDISSYPYIDDYVRLMHDELGCSVRITTVGYSTRNQALAAAHRAVSAMPAAVAGFRLSFTPYTFGATLPAIRRGDVRKEQFLADIAGTLATYRPLIEGIGHGRETSCVELRFAPLSVPAAVTESFVDGRHVITAGPHILVAAEADGAVPAVTRVVGLHGNLPGQRDVSGAPEPVFSNPGRRYAMATSDLWSAKGPAQFAGRVRSGGDRDMTVRSVQVYAFENIDGPYYAADPAFAPDGSFRALHVYPKSGSRRSGYNDASRFFLNELLEYKKALGIPRRADFPEATEADIQVVIDRLAERAAHIDRFDRVAAAHVRDQIIPLVADYGRVLVDSGLGPARFFSRSFTVDTGQVVNQGRARALFRGLVSAEDVPVTPWEERSNAISDSKGTLWRISPTPFSDDGEPLRRNQIGGKNAISPDGTILVQELSARYLGPVDPDTTTRLRRFRLVGVELERVRLTTAARNALYPGVV